MPNARFSAGFVAVRARPCSVASQPGALAVSSKSKRLRIHDFGRRHVAEARVDQHRARIEAVQDVPEPRERLGADEIGLVHDDHIAELDLLDQHFDDRAIVVFVVACDAALGERLRATRSRAGSSMRRPPSPSCRGARCRKASRLRSRRTRFSRRSASGRRRPSIRSRSRRSALRARVARSVAGRSSRSTDALASRRHVKRGRHQPDRLTISGDPQAFAVGEQVIQECGLARAEESGEHGDWNGRLVHCDGSVRIGRRAGASRTSAVQTN